MNNKGALLTAAFTGLLFGIFGYIVLLFIYPEDALMFSAFGGIFMFIVLYFYLLMHIRHMEKRYTEFEKNITIPIYLKTNGNFNLGKKVKNGNIYFCEGGIIFVSLDEKPYAVEKLDLKDILKYEIDTIHLNIYTKDNRMFVIATPDAPKVLDTLKEKGWVQ